MQVNNDDFCKMYAKCKMMFECLKDVQRLLTKNISKKSKAHKEAEDVLETVLSEFDIEKMLNEYNNIVKFIALTGLSKKKRSN